MLFIFSLAIILLLCVSVNVLHVSCLFFTNCNDYNLSTGSAFFCVHTDIDKDGDCLQSNINDSLNDLWLLFLSSRVFFFLKVWFNKRSNIKLRLLVILVVFVMLILHKHIKTPDHNEAIRSCTKHNFSHLITLILVRIFSHWEPN